MVFEAVVIVVGVGWRLVVDKALCLPRGKLFVICKDDQGVVVTELFICEI